MPQKSIDGVQMRDSRERVEEILGEPDAVGQGDFPGVSLEYTTDRHAGMDVTVYSDVNAGVVAIRLRHPYDGRTSGRMGIGSSRGGLSRRAGNASKTYHGEDRITNDYAAEGGTFFITSPIDDGLVHTITLHVPVNERIPPASN